MSPPPSFINPFRPGAGHRPPYLAGRQLEEAEFRRLLSQTTILQNMILTGLRGVGKTVLLEHLKPIALQENWLWVGTDLSEAASISEANLAERLLTDLSVVTQAIAIGTSKKTGPGFTTKSSTEAVTLNYATLASAFNGTPGLMADKLKSVFRLVGPHVGGVGKRGIVFAYDEAQNLADHRARDQFPLSLLLEVFQSIQRQDIPFMLLLVGLPTLFPKLVEARTYSERMFRVIFLKQLSKDEAREAIVRPVSDTNCPVKFRGDAIDLIYGYSRGYPYFIQFMCREAYDAYLQKATAGIKPTVPVSEIVRKLDNDFFAGRWARVTERQQQLLYVIAHLETGDEEFTVQEIHEASKKVLQKPFGRSHISQILTSLITSGLVYKDRHGKYLFAVPLMADFIKRAMSATKSGPTV